MKYLAPLAIIIAAALWGVNGVAVRPALYGLPVAFVVLVEHLLAFVIMLPFFIYEIKELKKLRKGDITVFILIAIFGGAIGTMAITKALFYVNFVNLSIVILIQKLQPVFALLLAWLWLKEKLSKKFFIWASLAVVATYFVTFGWCLPNFNTGDKLIGAALFSLLSAFAFGSSTVFSKRALERINFRVGTYLRFGFTSLIMLLIVLSLGEASAVTQVTLNQFYAFLIIVFFTGGSTIFLYYYGLKKVKASASTIYELAYPLTAIILEFILRGNVLSGVQWTGAVVLLFSIYKVTTIKESREV